MRFVATGPAETHVVLDQLGWKQGPAWDAGWKYFDDAWGSVLELFQKKFPLHRPFRNLDRAGRPGGSRQRRVQSK